MSTAIYNVQRESHEEVPLDLYPSKVYQKVLLVYNLLRIHSHVKKVPFLRNNLRNQKQK